jgi:hypothetical protein
VESRILQRRSGSLSSRMVGVFYLPDDVAPLN